MRDARINASLPLQNASPVSSVARVSCAHQWTTISISNLKRPAIASKRRIFSRAMTVPTARPVIGVFPWVGPARCTACHRLPHSDQSRRSQPETPASSHRVATRRSAASWVVSEPPVSQRPTALHTQRTKQAVSAARTSIDFGSRRDASATGSAKISRCALDRIAAKPVDDDYFNDTFHRSLSQFALQAAALHCAAQRIRM